MKKKPPKIPLVFLLPVIIACFILISLATPGEKIQAKNLEPQFYLPLAEIPIETKSQFTTEVSQKQQKIPFEVIYQKSPSLEWGTIDKSQDGITGVKLEITETIFWKGTEFGTRIYTKTKTPPTPQINLIGTKSTPGEIKTSDGKLTYKGKMRAFATSYDKNCRGCNETTATGARLTYGIAAVDPNFIPLGSKIYVPGYGMATAADVGGAIRGAKIDLAFDDVRAGFWSSRWTDVYLLE